MKTISTLLTLGVSLSVMPVAMATDLVISYEAKDESSFDKDWVMRDVEGGDIARQRVLSPDGMPLEVSVEVLESQDGDVSTIARIYEVKRTMTGRVSTDLITEQELVAPLESGHAITVVLDGGSEHESRIRLNVSAVEFADMACLSE